MSYAIKDRAYAEKIEMIIAKITPKNNNENNRTERTVAPL